jgi:hypothetical protein
MSLVFVGSVDGPAYGHVGGGHSITKLSRGTAAVMLNEVGLGVSRRFIAALSPGFRGDDEVEPAHGHGARGSLAPFFLSFLAQEPVHSGAADFFEFAGDRIAHWKVLVQLDAVDIQA